jgi:hypothetical protein
MPQDPAWVELYEYVRSEIMGYTKNIKLPKHLVLRLQGMTKGQYINNKKQKELASYDYKIILITFKFCKSIILQGIAKNKTIFNDENHKINYIMSIIDKEINNVVMRLKKAEKAEEKTVNLKLESQDNEGANYISTSKDVDKDLEGIW